MLITFEGPEGAGKTSVLHEIEARLHENGVEYLVTREPGGSQIAEEIRTVLLHPAHIALDSRAEALLFAAARAQHYSEKIAPALKAGKLVICDRFIDSSLVYQGLVRGLGVDAVRTINTFAIGAQMPDKTFLLDIQSEVGLARIQTHRAHEMNRLDHESITFHRKVRNGYLQLVAQEPERFIMIDAGKPLAAVVEAVWDEIQRMVSLCDYKKLNS